MEDMQHEPSRFVSEAFKEPQLWWETANKEVCAALSTFRIEDRLLWGEGIVIFCYHRTLAYILHSAATGMTLKAAAQRLQGRNLYIGKFLCTIVHIPRIRNSWVDSLSGCVKIGNESTAMNASVKYVQLSPENDDVLPDEQAVRGEWSAVAGGATEIQTVFGSAKRDGGVPYSVEHRGRRVLSITDEAVELRPCMMI